MMSSLTTGAKIVVGFVWYRTALVDVAHTFFTRVNVGAPVENC